MIVEVWTLRLNCLQKNSDEVDMISGMEDLVNFVHEVELVEQEYGSHFTMNEVKNI